MGISSTDVSQTRLNFRPPSLLLFIVRFLEYIPLKYIHYR